MSKSSLKTASRVAVAGLCGVLVVSASACTSHSPKAAPKPAANAVPVGAKAAQATSAPSVNEMSRITNLTPYTWTLATKTYSFLGPWLVQPQQTVQPGQTAVWSPNSVTTPDVITAYTFQDDTGRTETVSANDDTHIGFSSHSIGYDWHDQQESTNYTMRWDPDNQQRHVDAVWDNPITIKIDANTDPAAAAAIVQYELPRSTGDEKWTPAPGATPVFTLGDKTRASSLLTNNSDSTATLVTGNETSKGQSTSIGVEVSASVKETVDGVALKGAFNFTNDDDWSSSDSVAVEKEIEVEPGYTDWIDKQADSATLTGELKFSTPEQTTFDISNVALSKGDIAGTGAGGVPYSGMTFSPDDCETIHCGTGVLPATTSATTSASTAAAKRGASTVQPAATALGGAGQIVTIDAATDQADAVAALQGYETATDRSFTPSADPTYSSSTWQTVTDPTSKGNPAIPSISGNSETKQSITEKLTVGHTEGSSVTMGGSVETSIGFDLPGIVDTELSTKFTASHTWNSDETDTQQIWATAQPGETVWIEASTSMASYTGNFAFTNSDGVRYEVSNVTINQPASPTTDALSQTSYRIQHVASTAVGVPANTTGGLKAISTLPKLGAYINQGH